VTEAPPQETGEAKGKVPFGRYAGLTEITWGPATVGIGVLAAVALLTLVGGAVAVLQPESEEVGRIVAAQAVLGASLIAAPFLAARATGEAMGLAQLGLRAPQRSVLWGFAAYGAYLLFAILYATLITEPQQEDVTRGLGADEGTVGLVIAGLLIVGLAPIAEEVFFRGFMFGGFRRSMSLWPAAIASGVIFGVIHAPTGPTAVPPLIVLGVALGWLYERTGSIWPAIGVHAVNNAFAFTILVS
jgi:membrane protease YdiL (CAAX protease family)